MQAARAAASCAGRQTTGELRLGLRCERAGFLMPHMDPIDLAEINGVGEPVQRVADDAIAVLHAGRLQRLDHDVGYSFGHVLGLFCWHQ